MIVSSPIYHTRANRTLCAAGHKPRGQITTARGNCIRFHRCQIALCSSYVMGIQSSELDITIWYSVTRTQFQQLVDTPDDTHVLELLAIAGYYNNDMEGAA